MERTCFVVVKFYKKGEGNGFSKGEVEAPNHQPKPIVRLEKKPINLAGVAQGQRFNPHPEDSPLEP